MICLLGMMASMTTDGYSQCTISTLHGERISVEPIDEISLRYLVEDAALDQLALPGQGVCGVNLEFIHGDVSDLNMTLYGPDGQQVILVGPAVEDSDGVKLFGVPHDISFVPSSEPTAPDGGMGSRWDNQDPDWGSVNAYGGTYHPFSGDLDDQFGQGNVNGIWELVIIDQFLGNVDPSSFGSIELIFCDDNLTCNTCEADAGTFVSDTVDICEGVNFELESIYNIGQSDPALYTDILLSFSGNALFAQDELPRIEGSYESYVVTVLSEQETEFRNRIRALNRASILDLIRMRGGELCVDITDPLQLNIIQSSNIMAVAPDTSTMGCGVQSILLDGSGSAVNDSTMISWKDEAGMVISMTTAVTVTEPGIYSLVLQDANCLDSVSVVVINQADEVDAEISATIDTLDCTQTMSTLTWSTDFMVNATTWMTFDGETLSDDMELSVSAPGQYQVLLEGDGDCMSRDTIEIYADLIAPSGGVIVDTITCVKTQVDILSEEVSPNVIYSWQDADGVELSNNTMIQVATPGDYSLTLTAENTCDTTISFSVPADTLIPLISGIPTDTFMTCLADEIQLELNVVPETEYVISQSIDGPPFELIAGDPVITGGGQYQYIFNFENGCSESYETMVIDERAELSITDQSAIVTCDDETVQLSTTLDTSIYDIEWIGGNITGSNDPFPVVMDSAEYRFVGTHRRTFCTVDGIYSVASDRDDPMEVISGDTSITCLDPTAEVFILSDPDATISWIVGGDTTQAADIVVSMGDTLEYIIDGANGCSVQGTWEISQNDNSPSLTVDNEYQLDCSQSSDTITIDPAGLSRVGFIVSSGDTLFQDSYVITDTDLQQAYLEGENGCATTQNISISIDTLAPDIEILTADTTVCTPTDISFISNSETASELIYSWSLEGDELSLEESFSASVIGDITLMVTSLDNGCTATDQVSISLTANPLLGVEVDAMDESCVGTGDGSITVLSTLGGVEPITYAFDGVAAPMGMLSDLRGGEYILEVIDASNCTLDTTISIDAGEEIDLDLGPDQVIPVDDQVAIVPTIVGDIADFGWFVNGANTDASLDGYMTTVTQDLEVILQAFTANGCEAIDTAYIDARFTLDNVDMYIPNALVAGDAGANGSLRVSLPNEVIGIDEFRIYDRWGGLVHESISPAGRFNIPLWDGYRDGQLVAPGVYVYVCKVTTAVDGQSKLFKGNITVIN